MHISSTPLYYLSFAILLFLNCKENKDSNEIPQEDFQWDKYSYPSEENIQHQFKLNQSIKSQLNLRSPENPFQKKFKEQGPGNIGGRITSIAVHPTNTEVIYAGYSIGGLFKTSDGGKNWTPIFDNEITTSIGAIAIDPKNPEIIYVGTGDPDINGNSYIGNGLYKSVNGGINWTLIGLQEVRIINEIIIDPQNSNILYVGAMGNPFEPNEHRGVYKSTNSGLNWEKILFIAINAGVSDIDINPKNPDIIYASSFQRIRTTSSSVAQGPLSKIYKSIDGGRNWKQIMKGITNTEFSRIAIAVAPSSPNVIYARTVRNDKICDPNTSGYHMEGFYRSENDGENWDRISLNANVFDCEYMGGFGWYFGHISVNPEFKDEVYLLGVNSYYTDDAGISWNRVESLTPEFKIHVDHHILIFDKNLNALLGTDGGLYRFNRTSFEWKDIENIATTQFYRVAINPHHADYYYGGAQDNGTSYGKQSEFNNWQRVFGGDGFQAGFHSKYSQYAWYEYQYGSLYKYDAIINDYLEFRNGLNGAANWDAPFFLSAHNEDTMYFGTNKIFVNASPHDANWQEISPSLTTNGPFPNLGTPTVTCIHESNLQSGVIIAGTSNGNVWIRNPKTSQWTNSLNKLPKGYITAVRASETDINTFYISFSNYRSNDLKSYLFKSIDGGITWDSITSGLLDYQPINDFIILPNKKDQVIITATLNGLYGTTDQGSNWYRIGENMPFIPINSVMFNRNKNEIVAGTFARSLWTIDATVITKSKDYSKNNKTKDVLIVFNSYKIPIEKFDQINLINISGKIVQTFKNFEISNSEISTNELTQGIYFIQILSQEKTILQKIIKIH